MPVIISDSLSVSAVQTFDADNPLIGYEQLVLAANVTSGTPSDPDTSVDEDGFPASNVAGPETDAAWLADTAVGDVQLEIAFDGLNPIDYIGIASHNLGTARRACQLFGATSEDGSGDPIYSSISQEFMPADDLAILVRVEEANYIAVKLVMTDSQAGEGDAPQVAVIYAGKLLVMERKIQVSFTPITMGRNDEVLSGRSENGKFLGRIITSSWLECSVNFQALSPDWYREFVEPFVINARTEPFFFAWAPVSYPDEVGYAWFNDDVMPTITDPALKILSLTLKLQGIA
jgi:hypothetical protein